MLRLVCSWLLLGSAVVLPVGCTGCDADHGPIAEGVSGPLGSVVPYANEEQRAAFERGHEVIEKRFRRDEGLGPAFNVTFCGACHEKPTFGGSAGLYRNFLLSGVRTDDGVFVPGESFGRAGGVIRVYYYGDDERPRPVIPAATNVIAQRNAIPFFGVGLLAEIEEEEILRRSDPDDRDGDGISGRPNYDQGFVGRFGLKAQTVSIEGFIRGPLMNHLGITTDPLSEEQKARLPVDSSSRGVRTADARLLEAILPFAQAAAPAAPLTDDDGVADPEMSPQQLFDLVSFTMLLAAPELDPLDDKKRRGLRTFDEIGCKACHTPRLESPRGPLPVYSDLLLHDMGAALADGIEQGEATGSEFRTQPLWGLSAVGPYLHDGRAHTIDEAIDFHGGEAEGARDRYVALSDDEKDDLLDFLNSLGGRAQRSVGLIPPNTPLAEVGSYGGPRRELSEPERERFLQGRTEFDHEYGLSDGIGLPRYNGDSCRACHFEPTVGGAGPRGVNVMRHGVLDEEGVFHQPAIGSILHKVTRVDGDAIRPEDACNVFEPRQTPHVFGLGLVESIDADEIRSRADPDDLDGDGISGRAAELGGGVLGRFGWKAQIPSVDEFVRDALTAELGMSLEPSAGLSFGFLQDDDGLADPEFGLEGEQILADFLRELAPPPRQPPGDAAAAARGEQLFATVGCATCHVPALPGSFGPVALYSDLLLHDVLAEDARGVEEGVATTREFRTAPLWGISRTAPYLHDGSADTLEQAILGHHAEAARSRADFEVLSEREQADLLEFLSTL